MNATETVQTRGHTGPRTGVLKAQIRAPPLTSCVTLSEPLTLSGLPLLWTGDSNTLHSGSQ